MAEEVERTREVPLTSVVSPPGPFDAVQMIQDFIRMDAQARNIDSMAANLELMLGTGIGTADVQAKAGPEGNAEALKTTIISMYRELFQFWKAGIWQGVGATWSTSTERFIQCSQWIYAYKTLMYNAAIVPRMRRHWNRVYTPQVPDPRTAWHLYREKVFSWPDFERYVSYDGWDKTSAAWLNEVWNREPDSRTAFEWWVKDLIKASDRDDYYFLDGWEKDLHETVTKGLYYWPRPYELTRMADFVEMDQTWALKKLKGTGLNEEDRVKFWQMLQLRPLREEVRSLTSKWVWRFRMGRASLTELKNSLISLGVKARERELLVNLAQLQYEDELIDEWVEILTWRFRTAIITEDEFLDGLIDLGINQEKANLIVETQKAMGYYGYY